MGRMDELFKGNLHLDLKEMERTNETYLKLRYMEYVTKTDVREKVHHPLEFEKLSRFVDTDLSKAVKKYYNHKSSNAGNHQLDMVLFTRIADAFLDWINDYEASMGPKVAGSNGVDSIEIRRKVVAIRDMMRVNNSVTSENVADIISEITHAFMYQELRSGAEGASAFLDEPRSRIPQYFDMSDINIIYKMVIKKYNIREDIVPQSYQALIDIATVLVDRNKHPGFNPNTMNFLGDGLSFDAKIGICFLHQYIKLLNATELDEKIDDSAMIAENEVPKSIIEKVNHSMAKFVVAFSERQKAQMQIEQLPGKTDLNMYG
jgi:hypothetical protein